MAEASEWREEGGWRWEQGGQKEGPLRFTATGTELSNSDRVCEQLKPVVAFDQNYVSPPHGHHPGSSSLEHAESFH